MPFIPAWGWGAAALGSSIAGLFKGKKKDSTAASTATGEGLSPELQNILMENLKTSGQYGKELWPMAQKSLETYREKTSPLFGYWTRILSGDRTAMANALAPEISQITQGYGAAQQSASELYPRGGGTAAMMSELPFRRAADIGNLFSTMRPQAAGALGQLAGNEGNMGLGLVGATMNALTGQQSGISGLLNYGLNAQQLDLLKRQQNIGIWQGLGSSIFDIIKLIGGLKKGD